jgi:hypothetical protein
MAGPRTDPYFRGDDLPPLGLTWKQGGVPIDFSAGWTLIARLGTRSEPGLVELTTVSGLGPDASPNVIVTFADGDLDPLPIGLADGVILAENGGLQETMPFEMPIHRTIDAPTPP